MTFDSSPQEETGDDVETPIDSAFTEEEWSAIEALSEPGAIF